MIIIVLQIKLTIQFPIGRKQDIVVESFTTSRLEVIEANQLL